MKRISLIIAIVLATLGLSAQNVDGGATPILKKLASKYAAYTTMKIDYTYKCEKNDKVLDSKSGVMTIKGDKYTFVFGNQTSYCDGKTLWNYQKDVKEVSIFEYVEEEDNLLNPAKILSDWDKEYRAKFIREDTENNKLVQIIDLMPIQSSSFYKIRMVIDKAKQEIMSVSAFEKDNTIYSYYIDKFLVNTPMDDSSFVFDLTKYPDVDVNDMR
jgi:outer membrane lipoprotein-sorting protein